MGWIKCTIFLNLLILGFAFPTKPHSGNNLRDVDWWEEEQKALTNNLQVGLKIGMARNVIIFIGDGMGLSTVTAARVLKAQQDKKSFHEINMSWEDFPFTSLSKTYNVDQLTPDSAGTATAMLTGIKNNHGMLGVSQKAIKGNCSTLNGNELKSILHYSHEAGRWTGVVSTARITHATPAAAYASCPDRGWEADSDIEESEKECSDIAKQLVEDNDFIRVILGGGRRSFIPDNEEDPEYPSYKTRRADGRNLMKEWEQKLSKEVGHEKVFLVTNNTGFNAIDFNKAEYVMGLFEPSHMQYEVDREKSGNGEPSLAEMTEKAITMLSRSEKGYFLLVESGRIDHAHHENVAYKAMTETIAMSEAVAKAVELTNELDTLLVTTADHSHVFTIAGYPAPQSDILGVSRTVVTGTQDTLELELADDDLPYLPLSYANGPGYLDHRTNGSIQGPQAVRRNLTQDDLSKKTHDKDYKQDAGFYRKSETHGAEDVAVYARGPMSHLFHGSHEQTYIGHVMMYASCVGPNQKHCKESWNYPGCVNGANETKVMKGLIFVIVAFAVLRRIFY